jgi:N-acetylneuraminic acid mutarotase
MHMMSAYEKACWQGEEMMMMELDEPKRKQLVAPVSHLNSKASNHLLDLPEELVMEVFYHLPLKGLLSCTEVSSQMYRLAKDPSMWRALFVEKPVSEETPTARLWCSTVACNGKLFLYGGHTTQGLSNLISNVKNDLYCYHFASKKWELLTHQMPAKTEHKCVHYKNLLYFVGGYNGYDYTNDIYTYDPATKTSSFLETTGTPFSKRSALTAVGWKNRMLVFGGWNGFTRTWFNDVHEFNFDTKTWRQVDAKGTPPNQRTSHAAVVYKNCMYVYAGFSGDQYLNDLYEYNIETETWTNLTPLICGERPEPRSRFCAAVHGPYMYVLGGWNKVTYFNDFWMFNFETREWTKVKGSHQHAIPGISQYSLASYGEFLYVFGGFCATEKNCVNKMYVCHLNPMSPSSS